MKNEKGITLIELLVAVAIAGVVLVPLLTTMSESFTRTVKQGETTQLAYFGQEVMEVIRQEGYQPGTSPAAYFCLQDQGCVTAAQPAVTYDAKATVTAAEKTVSALSFYEITVTVAAVNDPSHTHQLVTVVKNR